MMWGGEGACRRRRGIMSPRYVVYGALCLIWEGVGVRHVGVVHVSSSDDSESGGAEASSSSELSAPSSSSSSARETSSQSKGPT